MKYRFSACVIGWLICCAVITYGADPSLVIDSAGNTRFIKKLIFTNDGTQLISVGDDKVIRVWDVKTGRTNRTIRDRVGVCADCTISRIALSPDNKYLAVGGKFPGADPESRFAIYVYNFETGQRLHLLKGHKARVTSLLFSPDSAQLASGSTLSDEGGEKAKDGLVRLWKVGPQGWEASKALSGHIDAVASLAFSPDGNTLVSGGHDTRLVFWNLTANPVVGQQLQKHNDVVFGVGFSPDGRFFVSGGLDRKLNVWDAQGKFLNQLAEQPSGVTSIAISPNKDNQRVLVGLENGTINLFSVPEGNLVGTFKGGDDKVYAVAFSSADENLIAGAGGFNGEIRLWRTDNAKPTASKLFAGMGQTVWKVGFARDGNSIAFGTQHSGDAPNAYGRLQQVIRLKPLTQKPYGQFAVQNPTYRISLGGNVEGDANYYSEITRVEDYELRTRYGQTVKRKVGDTFIDEQVRLYELQVFRGRDKVTENKRELATGRTHRAFTFTPDGRYIVSAGEDGYLALYETKNPKDPLHLFRGHTSDVWSVAVSPDGRFIVSGSSDQTIKLWDIKSEEYLLSIFVASDSEWVAWTPQGYYTSSTNGDRYIGWQVEQSETGQAEFYKAEQFQKIFYRPEVVSQYLATPDIQETLRLSAKFPVTEQVASTRLMTVFDGQDVLNALPPKIQIMAPANNEIARQRLMPVKVLVTSENFPITEVNVSLNGFLKGSFKGNASGEEKSKKVEIETMVALEPDENTLVVIASHERASSEPVVRTIFYKPELKQKIPGDSVVKPPALNREIRRKNAHSQARKQSLQLQSSGSNSAHVSVTPTRRLAHEPMILLSSSLPDGEPTVEILSPEDSPQPLQITEDSVSLKVRVGTVGPGTVLRILLNGTEKHKQTVESGVTLPLQIPLDNEGENVVTVMTTTAGVDSPPQTRRINFRNPAPERPNLIFLGIGISGYPRFDPRLQHADKDAEDVGKLLCKLHNSPLFKEVRAHVLSNEKATRENILREIAWMNKEAVHDNDVRVLLVSGHGGIWGATIQQYYFFARDHVPGDDPELLSVNWKLILERLLDRGNDHGRGPVLLFVDTCRAGEASPTQFMDVKKANGLVFFGASEGTELSKELSDNGAFTKAVLEGLSGRADLADDDNPKDGKIDFNELNLWLQRRLKVLNPAQHPSFEKSIGLRSFNIATTEIVPPANGQVSCLKDPNQ